MHRPLLISAVLLTARCGVDSTGKVHLDVHKELGRRAISSPNFTSNNGVDKDKDGRSGEGIETPKCTLQLFVPRGCRKGKDFSYYSVLGISLLQEEGSDAENSLGHCIKVEREREEECVQFSPGFRFGSYVECPRKNVVVIKEPATYINDTSFMGQTKYINNTTYLQGTTGLEIECTAKHPLNLRSDYDEGQVPFAGISVDTGQRLNGDYWLRFDIPPKNTRVGRLENYSGNFTVFSPNKSEIRETVQLQISGHNWTKSPKPTKEFIRFHDLKVDCYSSTQRRTQIHLVNVPARNPTEALQLKGCLQPNLTCLNQKFGVTCDGNPSCGIIQRVYNSGLIRCDDGTRSQDLHYYHGLDFNAYSNFSKAEDGVLMRLDIDDNNNSSIYKPDYDVKNFRNFNPVVKHLTFVGFEERFECKFVPYLILGPIEWIMETFDNRTKTFKNFVYKSPKNESTMEIYGKERGLGKEKIEIAYKSVFYSGKMTANMTRLSCRSKYWTEEQPDLWKTDKVAHSNFFQFTVEEPISPVFDESEQNLHHVTVGENLTLTCQPDIVGAPPPIFTWMWNGNPINGSDDCFRITNSTNSSTISVCSTSKMISSHDFSCTASNFKFNAAQKISVVIARDNRGWSSFFVACGVLSVFAILLFALLKIHLRTRARLNKQEIDRFMKGQEDMIDAGKYAHENVNYWRYDPRYEISSASFKIDESTILGSGAYGIVMKCKVMDEDAAVKTVLPESEKSTVYDLLAELKIMIHLGEHQHVIKLIGANTEFLNMGKPYVFVELCPMGSLKDFINKHQTAFENSRKPTGYDDDDDGDYGLPPVMDRQALMNSTMSHDDFIKWSIQIATGMTYLQERKVAHGDLAARNVLVTSEGNIKITDFGLSQQLLKENDGPYLKGRQRQLPWPHMSPESLRQRTFTSKSDVWSFGVTVWEIFSLCDCDPYKGRRWDLEFVQDLEDNKLRLPIPKWGNIQLYQILVDCWATNPEARPDFIDLGPRFEALQNSTFP